MSHARADSQLSRFISFPQKHTSTNRIRYTNTVEKKATVIGSGASFDTFDHSFISYNREPDELLKILFRYTRRRGTRTTSIILVSFAYNIVFTSVLYVLVFYGLPMRFFKLELNGNFGAYRFHLRLWENVARLEIFLEIFNHSYAPLNITPKSEHTYQYFDRNFIVRQQPPLQGSH